MKNHLVKRLSLYSILIVPVSMPTDFLDLKYSKIPANTVSIEHEVKISVDNSASPLFYKFKEVTVHKGVTIEGEVKIDKPLSQEVNDTYFQLGVVYEGYYKPNWLVRKILPEWLLKILSLNKKYGVGNIDFFT